jgi:hypothetical protein
MIERKTAELDEPKGCGKNDAAGPIDLVMQLASISSQSLWVFTFRLMVSVRL